MKILPVIDLGDYSTLLYQSTALQRVPALRAFWDLEKTVLHEIRVSGTVVGPLLLRKSPTCTYISQKPWYVVETVLVIFV